jgi:hypothetical protein
LLRAELTRDEVVRLDLFAKDSTRAAELLQNSLKSKGNQIVVDAVAQDRLKKKLKTEYVIFAEGMTADEIAQLLEQLGAEDKKAEAKKAGEGQFDKFVLTRLRSSDVNELARLLGVPAMQLKLPKFKNGTAETRKTPEPAPASKSAATPKSALVLPYGAVHSDPRYSKEIKQFLEKRGERKPGTLPMMLVIRTKG